MIFIDPFLSKKLLKMHAKNSFQLSLFHSKKAAITIAIRFAAHHLALTPIKANNNKVTIVFVVTLLL